mmetsp:Transcript_25123/g.37061  ORF Transcript_25123/g.37061 Transcript_25123/m.37061 type:complete len:82 (-) Transcript_25123:16-261(-)
MMRLESNVDDASSSSISFVETFTDAICLVFVNSSSNHVAILVLPTPAQPERMTAVGLPSEFLNADKFKSSSRMELYPGQEY